MEISNQSNKKLSLVKQQLKKEEFKKKKLRYNKLHNIQPITIIECKPNGEETYLLKLLCNVLNIQYRWSRKFKAPIFNDPTINKHGFIQNYDGMWYFIYQEKQEPLCINYIDNINFIHKYKDILSIKQLRHVLGITIFNITRRKMKLA